MRLLLDTHALLWASVDSQYLSNGARAALLDPDNILYVSAASAWEAGTKRRQGRLPEAGMLFSDFETKVQDAGYRLLSISCRHGEEASSFEHSHKDPFDRMIVAQALLEGLVLISKDQALDAFGIQRIW